MKPKTETTVETYGQMAHRLCAAQRGCAGCPLEGYRPCNQAANLPLMYPEQVNIISEWAKTHPNH